MKNLFTKESRRKALDTVKGLPAKFGAGATALMASGVALAGGGGSPGSAIAGELSTGKSEIMLIIGAVAILLAVLIVWSYVKRAK